MRCAANTCAVDSPLWGRGVAMPGFRKVHTDAAYGPDSRTSTHVMARSCGGCGDGCGVGDRTQHPGAGHPVVNMTGEVTRDSCSPCHMRLDEADTPGLIYSHGTHLLVACSACHPVMPHEGSETSRPTMAGCFACHGVPHSAGPVLGQASARRATHPTSSCAPSRTWRPGPRSRTCAGSKATG
jgi:hypothetical protein